VDQRFILVTLLVKLGVAAAVASAVVRSRYFKSLLFKDERSLSEKIQLALFIATPFALGVVVRVNVRNFLAADLSLESALLMGIIGGQLVGSIGGLMVALPALLVGDWIMVPYTVLAGLVAGIVRDVAPDRGEIWAFSPFIDLSLYRWVRRMLRRPRLDWQIGFFLTIVLVRFGRVEVAQLFHGQLPPVIGSSWGLELAAYATTVIAVGVPLKIWNSTRIEIKLEEQQRLLLQARMEALQNQINPHFLFNTLNSVASLVRIDPDTAREVIVKLASILRRLLRSHEAFVQLRDEVRFIDDYLDIEVVRFGRDKLHVNKDLDPETLDAIVPSMLLQPLVENSIKHGLSPKIEGGSITLRSRIRDGFLIIEVEDDGVGIGAPTAGPVIGKPSSGIGMANIAGRLQVLYGEGARMTVRSTRDQGTLVSVRLPLINGTEQLDSEVALAAYVRSNTSR
jgi:two-component system LytT family sensor kinase